MRRSRALEFWLSPFYRPPWSRGRGVTRDPLVTGDLLTFYTEPVAVAEGDPLRAALCLMCGKPAAGELVRVAALVHCQVNRYRPRALTSRAYVIHAGHFPLVDGEAHHAAHVLENPGCECRAYA